ncbi:hypothetical protein [Phocaeicola coprophilus]|uniref:hypothetical protein n=1 Tax=Phocaeicola coprophilus TaxID=387090 RepID=UPI001E144E6C|nr:hypothetical protein [Phocaeicola coprophilus]HJE47700.1 hypothetical protein [Phocaeicola coprophilus]
MYGFYDWSACFWFLVEAVERKNPDLKIGYVPVPAEIPVPAEALAREEMPAKVREPVPDRM